MYLNRDIEKLLVDVSKEYACLTIYGPRQVGKSTVVDKVFGKNYKQVTLDNYQDLSLAKSNPRLFLENYGWPLVIDEIQRAPNLLLEIKILIDEQKKKWLKNDEPYKLMYILTGSNQFELQQSIAESLAGRTAILNLSSLSNSELKQYSNHSLFDPNINVLKEKLIKNKPVYRSRKEIFEDIFLGGMPEYLTRKISREHFFNSYIATYIEKDVKSLIRAGKESEFLKFMEYIALRTGCQIEYSSVANAIGIDSRTVKEWLSILETSGLIVMLQPYLHNISDRIIKTPKLYFMDTGLCTYLCKWPTAKMLEDGPMSGTIYETYVVSEIIKNYYNHGSNPKMSLYYYRDRDQKEVDLIIDSANGIYPIEIKKGINPVSRNKNFKVLEKYKKNICIGLVIDSCDEIRPINDGVYYCPISLIGL